MKRHMLLGFLLCLIASFSFACDDSSKKNDNEQLLMLGLTGGGSELLVYYPLDGNLYDLSGQRRYGMDTGSIPFVMDRNSNPGMAASFDGSTQTLTGPPARYFKNNMTIAFWITIPSAVDGLHWIVISPAPVACGIPYNGTSKLIGFTVSSPATNTAYSAFDAGEWVHVAGTFDGTDIKIFINGSWVNTTPNPGVISRMDTVLQIGKTSSGSSIACSIDDFRIYNRVLTDTEILDLYNN